MIRFIPVALMALALVSALGMLGAYMRDGDVSGYFRYLTGFFLTSIGLAFMIG